MLQNDLLALIITLVLCLIWLRLIDLLAHRGLVSSPLSRKIIHISMGPLFVICWLLFTDAPTARYLAAFVPFLITLQFFLVGTGVIKDPATVQSMSRSGDRREILRGPLFYGIIFVLLTILFWKDSPVGMVALMLMCGGDGMADVIGRRIRSHPLPWNPGKTWAGSLAMFLGGLSLSVFILEVYLVAEVFPGPLTAYLPGLLVISLAGAVVESLPFTDVDNITTTLTAVLLGLLFF